MDRLCLGYAELVMSESTLFPVIASFLGSLIAGAVGAYTYARLRKTAEINAINANLQKVAIQAAQTTYAQTYAQEEAKHAATQAQMQLVLKNLEVVTMKTEEIKADVENQVWLRQTMRAERREVYSRLLAIVDSALMLVAHMDVFTRTPAATLKSGQLRAENLRKLSEELSAMNLAASAASLVADQPMSQLIPQLLDCLHYELTSEDNTVWIHNRRALTEMRARLGHAARTELGYNPSGE